MKSSSFAVYAGLVAVVAADGGSGDGQATRLNLELNIDANIPATKTNNDKSQPTAERFIQQENGNDRNGNRDWDNEFDGSSRTKTVTVSVSADSSPTQKHDITVTTTHMIVSQTPPPRHGPLMTTEPLSTSESEIESVTITRYIPQRPAPHPSTHSEHHRPITVTKTVEMHTTYDSDIDSEPSSSLSSTVTAQTRWTSTVFVPAPTPTTTTSYSVYTPTVNATHTPMHRVPSSPSISHWTAYHNSTSLYAPSGVAAATGWTPSKTTSTSDPDDDDDSSGFDWDDYYPSSSSSSKAAVPTPTPGAITWRTTIWDSRICNQGGKEFIDWHYNSRFRVFEGPMSTMGKCISVTHDQHLNPGVDCYDFKESGVNNASPQNAQGKPISCNYETFAYPNNTMLGVQMRSFYTIKDATVFDCNFYSYGDCKGPAISMTYVKGSIRRQNQCHVLPARPPPAAFKCWSYELNAQQKKILQPPESSGGGLGGFGGMMG